MEIILTFGFMFLFQKLWDKVVLKDNVDGVMTSIEQELSPSTSRDGF